MRSPDYQQELGNVFQKCRTLVTTAEHIFPEEQGTNNNCWWFNLPHRKQVAIMAGRWTAGNFRSTPNLSRFEVKFQPMPWETARMAIGGLVGTQFDPALILELTPSGKYLGSIEYWPRFGDKHILDLKSYPSIRNVLQRIDKQLVQQPISIGTVLANPDFIRGKRVAPQDEAHAVVRPVNRITF